jgi:hypothetical protein
MEKNYIGRTFIKGDIHGSLTEIIDFIHKFNLQPEDNIIVLGDFGVFFENNDAINQEKKDYYEMNCNGVHLYWIDGNHENFDVINSWNCNNKDIYDNSNHIHYLPRGFQTFIEIDCGDHIENRKALFIGGADSVDTWWRTEHETWWADETITEDDIKDIKGSFYYIFSHCGPRSVVENNKGFLYTLSNINENNNIHKSEDNLEKLKNNIIFNQWWFGHYHTDIKLGDNYRCLYKDFIELK